MKNKLQKALSLLLAVIMIFSVGVFDLSSKAENTATYYVGDNNTDTQNGTLEHPFDTVEAAIKKAVASGMDEGDTVYVKIVSFDSNWGNKVDYDFDLEVSADIEEGKYNIHFPKETHFGGNVSFSRITLNTDSLFFDGHNVHFDLNCNLRGNNLSSNYYLGAAKGSAVLNESQTAYFGAYFTNSIFLTDIDSTNRNYEEDVNLYIDYITSTPKVILTPRTSGNVEFKKNLNIDLMNASKITFEKGSGTAKVNGAIQLIVSNVGTLETTSIDILKSLASSGKFYHIVNKTGVDDMLTLTETAGKYIVDTDRYDVTATDKNGAQTKAKNGYLTLPAAGEYEITAIKAIENPVYYVSSSGSPKNTGLTKDSPLLTIGDAILAAKEAGYWGGDNVTVKVLSKTINWGVNYSGKVDKEAGLETKVKDRIKEDYGYEFLLTVTSDNTANKATLSMPNLSPMLGDVVFDYIKINKIESFVGYDDDVTMTQNTSFNPNYISLGYRRKSNTVEEKVNLTLKNQFNGYIQTTNDLYSGKTFNKDVTITVNNSNSTPKFIFVLYWGGATTFNGNLNIDIQNSKSVAFGAAERNVEGGGQGKTTANKAVHIIVNSKTTMDSASITNLEGLSPKGKLYHISNASGIADLLEFTENEGEFKINSKYQDYVVTAVDDKGTATASVDGSLKLSKAGYYSLSAQKVSTSACTAHKYTNNCDAMCNICGKTRKITHNFKFNCSVACLNCGIKRSSVYHTVREKPAVTPATETKDGESWDVCENCNAKLSLIKTISKIAKYEVTPTSYVYDGKQKTPKVRISDSEGIRLEPKTENDERVYDYTLSYPKNRKNPGVYKIKVTFSGDFSGTKYLTFTIKPPKTKVKSVSSGDKKLKVTVNKNSKVSGYEIEYSTSKKFTNAKTKTLSSYKKTSVTIKNLKAQKNYYVRVRTYKNSNGTKIYSSWSSAVKKKTKGVAVAESKITSVTPAKKSLKVKVKKTSKVKGYQIQYSTSSKFSKPKTKTLKGYKKTSATIKKLKANTNYYVRVRTFKTVGKKKYYSDWSNATIVMVK